MDPRDIINDFKRRYLGTYIQARRAGEEAYHVYYVENVVDADNYGAVLNLKNNKVGKITINWGTSDYDIKFDFPKTGVFQCGKNAAIYLRVPKRQWRRGICIENSTMVSVLSNVANTRGPVLNTSSIQDAFDHTNHDLAEAFYMMDKEIAQSVALPHDFAISLPLTKDNRYHLFHWGRVIGYIRNDRQVLAAHSKVYSKDLKQLVETVPTIKEIVYV